MLVGLGRGGCEAEFVAQQLSLVLRWQAANMHRIVQCLFTVFRQSANDARGNSSHDAVGRNVAHDERAGADDAVVADDCARHDNGAHPDKYIVADIDGAENVNIREFFPEHPDSAIVRNELHTAGHRDVIAEGDEVWFASEIAFVQSASFSHAHAKRSRPLDGIRLWAKPVCDSFPNGGHDDNI